MSIIFFLTEEMLRHMKINVSFGPSSGTDMSNFRPWLMDYIQDKQWKYGKVKKSWTHISDFPSLTSIYYSSIKSTYTVYYILV